MILKTFVVGWVVLVVAIIFNFAAMKLGISTWYEFSEIIGKNGFVEGIKKTGLVSLVFLFIIYPFLLGFAAFITLRLLKA